MWKATEIAKKRLKSASVFEMYGQYDKTIK